MNKKTLLIIIFFLTSPLFTKVSSISFVQDTRLRIDRSISSIDREYSIPKEIVLVPITINRIIDLEISPIEWFRGIYYYSIKKLGFSDIPFHFLVSSDGHVIKGLNDILDRRINFGDFNENSIIVGYLNLNKNTQIDPIAESNLRDLLVDICNKNNINPRNITLTEASFYKEKSSNTISIRTKSPTGLWSQSLEKIRSEVSTRFNPTQRNYNIQILGFEIPDEPVNQATEVEVGVRIKNIGSFGVYPNSDSSLYLSKEDGGISNFYLPSSWSTFGQIEITKIDREHILLPQEETVLNFKVRVPLFSGVFSEKFIIRNAIGRNIQSNSAELKLNIKDVGRRVVSIRPVPNGILNIRSGPGTNFNVVTTVAQGSRFFFIEQNDLGWVHIDLLDGRTGWTAIWNIQFL